ncbi:MAG: glycosyltransferase [Bacteroidales bacterium]|nr:glycosyltransferase [Bacteroidales bacterium]MCM1147037.1 glycosyltransferase [Bacteroidales bacterium]MCM1205830.1 glycosyltransferase [Bacillota bacterium]MCM1509927.1 glycosyltransferase [Clostridium sp.]
MNCTAVIILNYNTWQATINCIESVEKYNTARIKYIVVDNGSADIGAVSKLERFLFGKFNTAYSRVNDYDTPSDSLQKCTFVVSNTNDGYACGNNKGLKFAYEDKEISHILILNNDILFVEDIIPALLKSQESLPNVAIVSPCLYKNGLREIDYTCARRNYTTWSLLLTYLFMCRDLFGYISCKTHERQMLSCNSALQNEDFFEIELPSGSCMMIPKNIMRSIGGFDSNTFLFFEENILYHKIKNLGLKNYLLPKFKCIHLGASSTSKSSCAFILSEECNSAEYYLKNYACLTLLQRFVLPIAMGMMRLKIKIIKLVKG